VCGSKFVHHGATTRLNKHLIQKHNIKLAVVNKNNDSGMGSGNQNDNENEPKIHNNMMNNQIPARTNNFEILGHALMNGYPPLQNGHSDMSHFNSKSNLNPSGMNYSNVNNSSMQNGNISSSKNTNFSDSNMLLVSFILSSSTSIDLLDNKWFRMFIENLNSNYKLPTKDELNGMFKNLYKEKKTTE
jgi:hypothetical protein